MWRFVMCLVPCMALAQVEQGDPNAGFDPVVEGQTRAAELPASEIEVSVFASGFDFPWGIAALPDGRFLVTQRGGTLSLVEVDGTHQPVEGVPEVHALRQGGLLDVAVSQDFAESGMLYLTYAKPMDGGSATAAAQAVLVGTTLEQVEDIFVQSPAQQSGTHFGSRIVLDEGGVWITTGDRGTPDLAQGDNTVGKVIRVGEDGPEVWSTGHRNIQGAVSRGGVLWTVEHGPRGGDELNQPQEGMNYGWPVISYGINYSGSDIGAGIAVAEGMERPVYYWDPVIAPGGMAAYPRDGAFEPWRGDLFVSSLNPGGLMRLKLEDGRVIGEERLLADMGRVRDVEVLVDGSLLVLLDAPDADILRVRPVGGGLP